MKKIAFLCLLTLFLFPEVSYGFCGFYVSGGGAKLFNNATQVVLMRDGKRTILSMQNNYEGPPENFAMVVPVPVVLKEKEVKTLDNAVFDRIDQLDAPRLVEYWEQDPCDPYKGIPRPSARSGIRKKTSKKSSGAKPKDLGVKIEAQFDVGEYQIVILSAKDSTGLDTWLRDNGYNIPKGAEEVLRPYVESGMKFFVAKVDVKKVTFKDNQAVLSPLRFHYDSKEFALPVRLGLLNSSGKQDLIVHILAKDRYEASNYKNVTIPTNINVAEGVKEEFGPFYASLFDKTLEKNPGAVITEYSWAASSCDPCPVPPLSASDLTTLGADVLPETAKFIKAQNPWSVQSYFVLTRLHARYDKDNLGEDIIFQKAEPIVGGREFVVSDGKLEEGSVKSSINNFQGRYAIRHPWEGPIACKDPKRGIWGGPPDQPYGYKPQPKPAQNLAFVPRGKVKLASLVKQDIPEIGLKASKTIVEEKKPEEDPKVTTDIPKEETGTTPPAKTEKKAAGCTVSPMPSSSTFFLGLFAIVFGIRFTRTRQ